MTITVYKTSNCIYSLDENGKRQGLYKEWSSKGILRGKCIYKDGRHHGEFISYKSNGAIVCHCLYKNGVKFDLSKEDSVKLRACSSKEEYLMLCLKFGVPLLKGEKYEVEKD